MRRILHCKKRVAIKTVTVLKITLIPQNRSWKLLECFFRFSPRRFTSEKVLDEQIRCQTRNQGFWDDFRIIPWGFSSRISDQPFIAMHPRHFFDCTRYLHQRGISFFMQVDLFFLTSNKNRTPLALPITLPHDQTRMILRWFRIS